MIYNYKYDGGTWQDVDDYIPYLEVNATPYVSRDLFKSHQPYQCDVPPCRHILSGQAPTQCRCPNCAFQFERVIYLIRDARPTLLSYWNFTQNLGLCNTSFQTFLGERRYPGVSWSDHIRSWMSAPVDILFVKYEDMVADAPRELRRVLRFLRWHINETLVRRAVAYSARENMSRVEVRHGNGYDRYGDFRFIGPGGARHDYDEAFYREHGYMLERWGYRNTLN